MTDRSPPIPRGRRSGRTPPARTAVGAIVGVVVVVLMLVGVFAWYFGGPVPVDLALWWAACFSP